MKNFNKELLISIAEEMYRRDGKYYSESYSSVLWKQRGWPEVDNEIIYKLLDSYIRFLRHMDEYNGIQQELWKTKDIFGRIK